RLPRQLPLKIAMGMMLTAKDIDAQTAQQYGLVNEVVPHDQLMQAAERWAHEILQCAPLSVRGTKEGALRGLDLPLETAIHRDYYWLQRHNQSPDRVEGPRAFSEKRQPQWKGL